MRAAEVSELLRSWRTAERRWEAVLPGDAHYEAARNAVAEPWLAYQEASGSVAQDELVLVADDEMRYVAANETAHRALGYPPGGLIGRSIPAVTPSGNHDRAVAAWEAFLQLGRLDGTYELLAADGRILEVTYLARAHLPVAGLHVSRLRVVAERYAMARIPAAGQSEPPEEGAPAVRGEGAGTPRHKRPQGERRVSDRTRAMAQRR